MPKTPRQQRYSEIISFYSCLFVIIINTTSILQIIQDGLCENSLPNIFDDSIGGNSPDPRCFMQFKHRITFVGTDVMEEDGSENLSWRSSKLMEQMCGHKDVLGSLPGGLPAAAAGLGSANKSVDVELTTSSITAAVRRVGDKMSILSV